MPLSALVMPLSDGLVLPLFKGKDAEANNKDNYHGITLFSTLCKMYEMIILNRLEKFASQAVYISESNLGSRKDQAVLRYVLQYLRPLIIFLKGAVRCFLDVRKTFDTVWIDGLLYESFSDVGVNSKLWLAIKGLYTDVTVQVLYSGALSREFEISQGTGQGRISAPLMYKVYINNLLKRAI